MPGFRVHVCTAVLLLAAFCAPAAAEAPPDPSWEFSWWPKLELKRSDDAHRVRLGGRALFDGAAIHYGDGLVNRNGPPGWNVEAEVRQGRIGIQGHFFHHLEFKTEVDFAATDPDPGLTDAYIGLRQLGPVSFIRFGHQKVPFSFESEMSRRWLVFMERSLANSLDSTSRDVGVRIQGNALEKRLLWIVGGYRATEATGRAFTDPTNWVVAGRVSGLPYWADEGRRLLHLGGSYTHGFRSADPSNSFRERARPEANLADNLIDTGDIAGVDAVNRIEVDFVWVHGPFSMQGEYAHAFLNRSTGAGNLDFVAYYAHANWFVTGEHRVYNRDRGIFGAVKPHENFDPAEGGWGALQLGLRVSYNDLNDRDVSGGRETDLTLGANWFLNPFLRLTFNWVHGWVASEDEVDVLQGRIQIVY